ncbi:NAD(P)H-binding protein [Micrococcus lylae]|uniref:NAD(P)H-binding protein n=1 Tax=Micrococcus lylae TaxID=1273 RepID=UPI003EB92BD1
MDSVVVVGASGYLGRHVVASAAEAGREVHAVVRDRGRAEAPGPFGAPPLAGRPSSWVIGDVTDPDVAARAAARGDWVISALGATGPGPGPWAVDFRGNLTVLDAALRQGVRRFTYTGVLGLDEGDPPLVRAKAAFAAVLRRSAVCAQVVNPSAFFSDLGLLLRSPLPQWVPGSPRDPRMSPIHGADLAEFILTSLPDSAEGTWDVGGPETLRWSEVVALAGRVRGVRTRFLPIPASVGSAASRLVRLVSPPAADGVDFLRWTLSRDQVGSPTGRHRLADFLDQEQRGRPRRGHPWHTVQR